MRDRFGDQPASGRGQPGYGYAANAITAPVGVGGRFCSQHRPAASLCLGDVSITPAAGASLSLYRVSGHADEVAGTIAFRLAGSLPRLSLRRQRVTREALRTTAPERPANDRLHDRRTDSGDNVGLDLWACPLLS